MQNILEMHNILEMQVGDGELIKPYSSPIFHIGWHFTEPHQ